MSVMFWCGLLYEINSLFPPYSILWCNRLWAFAGDRVIVKWNECLICNMSFLVPGSLSQASPTPPSRLPAEMPPFQVLSPISYLAMCFSTEASPLASGLVLDRHSNIYWQNE